MKIQNTNNQQSFGMAVKIKAKKMTSGELGLIDKHSQLVENKFEGLLARISVRKDGYMRNFVIGVSEIPQSRWQRAMQYLGFGIIEAESGNVAGATTKLISEIPEYNTRFTTCVEEAYDKYSKDKGVIAKKARIQRRRDALQAKEEERSARISQLQKLRSKYPDMKE